MQTRHYDETDARPAYGNNLNLATLRGLRTLMRSEHRFQMPPAPEK